MTGRALAYAQLLRLPNVFTAFSDILMAGCAVGAISADIGRVAVLMIASGCLYLGGMVWNDVFDRKEDAKTRPTRPLPSNRVSVSAATIVGTVLLSAGILVTLFVPGTPATSYSDPGIPNPFPMAIILAILILLYNAWLKRTPFGPISMGGCRFFNVILGLCSGTILQLYLPHHLAGVIGLYIVGVTWFARTEEGTSRPAHLMAASGVMFAALGLALAVPLHLPPGTVTPLYPYLLIAFGFWIGIALMAAIRKPTPQNVQAGVKRCILGLILLDTILATAFVGPAGLLIGLLLLPARGLGKWVYST